MGHVEDIGRKIRVGVITVSDTRTTETDKGGALVQSYLDNDIYEITHYRIVKDDVNAIQSELKEMLNTVDAVITTGGTGIAKRDVTIEAVSSFFVKELEGFGEIFRMLSYTEDIGSRSILSRATAGTTEENKLIISLPGSTGAVKLAMERLVVPELQHMISELNK